MLATQNVRQQPVTEEQDIYTFQREDGAWYVQLPAHLANACNKADLRMAEGAHKFLNVLSKGAGKLRLRVSLMPHPGAGVLELVEHCPAPRGGGIYDFTPVAGDEQGALYWICDLALFVFGDLPDRIYIQCLPEKTASMKQAAAEVPSRHSSNTSPNFSTNY